MTVLLLLQQTFVIIQWNTVICDHTHLHTVVRDHRKSICFASSTKAALLQIGIEYVGHVTYLCVLLHILDICLLPWHSAMWLFHVGSIKLSSSGISPYRGADHTLKCMCCSHKVHLSTLHCVTNSFEWRPITDYFPESLYPLNKNGHDTHSTHKNLAWPQKIASKSTYFSNSTRSK